MIERYKDGERNFFGANLSGANLSGARLFGCNLSGVDSLNYEDAERGALYVSAVRWLDFLP